MRLPAQSSGRGALVLKHDVSVNVLLIGMNFTSTHTQYNIKLVNVKVTKINTACFLLSINTDKTPSRLSRISAGGFGRHVGHDGKVRMNSISAL